MLLVPPSPRSLLLPITRRFDGSLPEASPSPRASLRLALGSGGLTVEAELTTAHAERVAQAPVGARVSTLWEYDVVELFWSAAGGRYLELELGAQGHWLVLSFSGVRRRSGEHLDLQLEVAHERSADRWRSRCVLPLELLPAPLEALGAFAIAGGEFLSYSALPGAKPDFHQPQSFPRAALET